MTSAAKITLRLVFFLALAAQAQQATDPVQIAEEEAVRRQEATIRLHLKLEQADAARKRGQLIDAGKLYQESVALIPFVQIGNPAVDFEKKEALAGLDGVREKLARQAMDRGAMTEASAQVDAALKVDPNNESLRKLKAEIEQRTVDMQGTVPSADVVKTVPDIKKEKIDVATQVQNAKLFYEMGKYEQAETILVEVLRADPSNKTAPYYLDLVREAKYSADARAREALSKKSIGAVEKAWITPDNQMGLPVPNPMVSTNLVYTTEGRQKILGKLQAIRLNEVQYDLPLSEVLNRLRIESQKRDPDGQGINFMWNGHADVSSGAISTADQGGAAAAGAAAVPAAAPVVDDSTITIHIAPPLDNLRMADVLDAITKVADQPIKFTIEDYAVVFSPKAPEAEALYTKVFRVDPNTFIQGLENVISTTFNPGTQTSSGLGGAGGGGGGGGGAGGGQNGTPTASISSVQVSAITQGGAQGGGGGITGGQGGNAIGLRFVTKTNSTQDEGQLVRLYFTAAGVNLTDPGKIVFFNDRLGELMVRASLSDLEIIEEAVELLNQAPPQVTIEAKFVELSQEDSRALGFNWYLGNTLVNNGAIGFQGGTAPSYGNTANGTPANPSGVFPGPGSTAASQTPGYVAPSATDNLLTAGLRNTFTSANTTGPIPTVGTVTGILTDPQFRVAIEAVQQRTGSDLLSAPKVTTLSGRQTHIAAQDVQYIVTTATITENSSATTGLVGGSGVVAPSVGYTTVPYPLGPSLDVMPTVSSDGYSIQMVLIPSLLEFIGYDPPGAFVPTAEAAAGNSIGVPVVAQLPLPHFRVREVVTTCNVWDGQTVVLGGMIAETISKIKDEIPVLGDLPMVGRLFQSESSDAVKQNLLIFVTPTIIDPAGNPVHNEEDMPFARNGIPPQPPVSTQ